MQSSKREALLETAERLFYAEGFHATGIDRVIAEAGVARMTLYNHFSSKEALTEAVLERRYTRYLDDLRRATASPREGSAVVALAERHADWLRSDSGHGCIVIKAIGEFEYHHPPIAELGRKLKRALLGVIVEALERDGHGAQRAECILMALEGADALAPVLGPQSVSRNLRAMVSTLRADMPKATSVAHVAPKPIHGAANRVCG